MATLFILIGLLPSLLCELPAVPIKLSKETTFITEPLAGDGLPNYALAIQELEAKGVMPEQNGAIPFWQAMGQYQMSDEQFQRLSREIGLSPDGKVKPLVPLESESIHQAVTDWLRETGRSSDDEVLKKLAEGYVEWVQENPWIDKDVPPLAKWLAENEQALDLLVEASKKPSFYSPYPNLIVDRTISAMDMLVTHAVAMRKAARTLLTRAMYRVGQDDLEEAWSDCRTCIALGNCLISGPILVEQLVAIAVRRMGLSGAQVILSQPNLSPALARRILSDLTKLDRPIDVATVLNHGERMMALDYMLRMTTGRLGGLPTEEEDENVAKIVEAGVDLNLSLLWLNERYDRTVKAASIADRKERVSSLNKLAEEFEEDVKKLKGVALGSILSQTFRSNIIGEICFTLTFPDLKMIGDSLNQHEHYSELTKVSAALAVYKAEHGKYPNTLAALSPSLLKEIPNDLYTNEPLCYKLVDDGYLLYSVFENEADDGGTDVDGEIRDGEWQADKKEIDREKCDLVIRIPVVPRPKP